ncbi:2-dehydro-3-deoxyphosphogluconate aldolase/(4S)-4-hydroxy-2-oxoglutarate aldolase [Rathayibacter sp. PhB127]|uniref:bifunctional 4-hydroxy-2-oxoglutarate aldolase/2-dehydro-3-deoxy-phosphogluconate aldolase n=1 Tax=unclassified Rathayibacter TaxID=2609250 RepID=UPI000F4D193E|nr:MULTISPECIES: bifunctional 4-hydroxy-2-oxoglutarate aldolase/2-dehydro-3-deoxy-phosphogluconate aldolase [unclassified Rathayibacter]ROS21636.1 2-dehydro-3-deoxyphosphogluconate aldolase/(4S)-4-hydroxy-2-oxoglutarate aldolase [Rathayibacter sp. PhB127]TDX77298.1 2-dehydro-3-deoxyphosphogluconate aldolase/(4S)-4-hydroxy-2-oxoglutarate aldolase [Rathayibacter sp. PhB151]
MTTALDVMRVSPVIPVVTLLDPETAVPVARALLAGGVGLIELTLRTETALESLALIAADVPEMLLGAGTVLSAAQADAALAAGAQFLVSPGLTRTLHRHFRTLGIPVLPGVSTVGEVMTALEEGATELKFFPAGPAGGAPYLAALGAPIPHATFCPTGGISVENAGDYLSLPNVACVGGSWLTPQSAIDAQDWDRITAISAAAAALAPSAG